MVLRITYSDGSTDTVSSGFATIGFSSTSAGTKTVKKKKRGKVELSFMLNYIKENENNGLNEATVSSLMEILRVNHIDFWRS